MSAYRYSKKGVVGEYLRAGAGAIPLTAMFFLVDFGLVGRIILLLIVMLFIGYGLSTWQRQHTTVYASDDGVLAKGWLTRNVAWNNLESVRLNYYSTKRDRKEGWMQLSLKASGTRLKIYSTLDGFERIVARAAKEAANRRIELSPTTVENMHSMGIEAGSAESRKDSR